MTIKKNMRHIGIHLLLKINYLEALATWQPVCASNFRIKSLKNGYKIISYDRVCQN